MKIGILTFHRALNFGAVLQTYALQEILKTLGYETYIIDYKQPQLEKRYRPFSLRAVQLYATNIKDLLRYFYQFKSRIISNKLFSDFKKKFLNCTSPCVKKTIPKDFDIYLIGSDQLWNIKATNGIDTVYWGEINSEHGKVYGYAISGTVESIKSIPIPNLTHYMNNFSQISFRENKLLEEAYNKTGIMGRTDIDPTLLADLKIWDKITKNSYNKKKYILIYEVRKKSGKESKLMEAALSLSKRMGCEIVDASKLGSPDDFVTVFKYATYAFTSSFHGTAFSLIFHKDFSIVTLNDGRDERYVNLLKKLGYSHLLSDIDNIKLNLNIDYANLDKNLEKLRFDSLNYLSSLGKN